MVIFMMSESVLDRVVLLFCRLIAANIDKKFYFSR